MSADQQQPEKSAPHERLRIGCIGLGAMGLPIARHLQAAGYTLLLHARRPEAYENELKTLIDGGAGIAASPAEMAASVDIILTNVHAGADMVDLVIDRHDAILKNSADGPRNGLVIVDHSTIDPQTAQRLYAAAKAAGAAYVDAPVSGGAAGAEAGTLVTMMGGDADVIERIFPVTTCYTARQRHMGGPGQGSIAKLCNQIAQVIAIEGVAEAMAFATSHGADREKVMDVMLSGFASSRMLELLGPKMHRGDYTPGMESRLLDKDVGIALDAAAAEGLDMPALAEVGRNIATLQSRGWQEKDISIIFELLRK